MVPYTLDKYKLGMLYELMATATISGSQSDPLKRSSPTPTSGPNMVNSVSNKQR